MKKEFVNYEQAIALKELGFDEPCFGYYLGVGSFVFKECDENIRDGYGNRPLLRPTFSQAFRWFREKYDICPSIEQTPQKRMYDFRWGAWGYTAKTYEEGELACLDRLIEIVKKGY